MVRIIVVVGCAESRVLIAEPRDFLLQAFIFITHELGLRFEFGDFGFESFDAPLFSFPECTLSMEKRTS